LRGEHTEAVICFSTLFELIDFMERGESIVFAHELGSWMIPGDEQQFIAAYLTSLAATAAPEDFVAAVLPQIRRDSHQSFANSVYAVACGSATDAQRLLLDQEILKHKIQTP
jgi:hypothetical protein